MKSLETLVGRCRPIHLITHEFRPTTASEGSLGKAPRVGRAPDFEEVLLAADQFGEIPYIVSECHPSGTETVRS